jgi:hypothetical protein
MDSAGSDRFATDSVRPRTDIAEEGSGRADAVGLNIDTSRKELEGFGAYYRAEIEPWMVAQTERQAEARRFAWRVGVAGAIGLPILVGLLTLLFDMGGGSQMLVLVYAVGVAAMALWPLRSLQKDVKSFLVAKVCGFFGFEASESATAGGFEHFNSSGLLPRHDRSKLEDEIRGEHGGVPFDLVECRLEDRRRNNKGGSYYVEIYHGILFRFRFPKKFQGCTIVTRDSGRIGNFFKGVGAPGERIELEDPRFEQQFEVRGTDQIEARYLLTPAFMERVVELAEVLGGSRPALCFDDNRLLISVCVREDHFEGGGIFDDVADRQRVERLVRELCKIFDIIDTLKLTLRTKV